MATYPIEGVSSDVNKKMEAVFANVLAEDNALLRTCEHGIAHQVGHLGPAWKFDPNERRHERGACDGCCGGWE